jgi:hypothetical protein
VFEYSYGDFIKSRQMTLGKGHYRPSKDPDKTPTFPEHPYLIKDRFIAAPQNGDKTGIPL